MSAPLSRNIADDTGAEDRIRRRVGGAAMSYRIPLVGDSFDTREMDAIQQVLESGRYTQGKQVHEFEAAFADYMGRDHAIMVNSGSSANLVAITALSYAHHWADNGVAAALQPGDEVIIQALCWPTTLTPLFNNGLKPVFCDVDPVTLNAGVADLEKARTSRTKAVIAVPVLGNPAGSAEVRKYCDDNDLVLIEDACESLGATGDDGRKVGQYGAIASFSFYFSHHITTIEGGCVVTDCPVLASLCRAVRDHGWIRNLENLPVPDSFPAFEEADDRYCFLIPGYNVRSTEISAAIGLVQLDRLDDMLAERRRVARERISAIRAAGADVGIPGADNIDAHSWMGFSLIFDDADRKNEVGRRLEEAGIETRPVIVGNIVNHPMAAFFDGDARAPTLTGCDTVFRKGLMLGMNPQAPQEDEAYLRDTLVNVLGDVLVDRD